MGKSVEALVNDRGSSHTHRDGDGLSHVRWQRHNWLVLTPTHYHLFKKTSRTATPQFCWFNALFPLFYPFGYLVEYWWEIFYPDG